MPESHRAIQLLLLPLVLTLCLLAPHARASASLGPKKRSHSHQDDNAAYLDSTDVSATIPDSKPNSKPSDQDDQSHYRFLDLQRHGNRPIRKQRPGTIRLAPTSAVRESPRNYLALVLYLAGKYLTCMRGTRRFSNSRATHGAGAKPSYPPRHQRHHLQQQQQYQEQQKKRQEQQQETYIENDSHYYPDHSPYDHSHDNYLHHHHHHHLQQQQQQQLTRQLQQQQQQKWQQQQLTRQQQQQQQKWQQQQKTSLTQGVVLQPRPSILKPGSDGSLISTLGGQHQHQQHGHKSRMEDLPPWAHNNLFFSVDEMVSRVLNKGSGYRSSWGDGQEDDVVVVYQDSQRLLNDTRLGGMAQSLMSDTPTGMWRTMQLVNGCCPLLKFYAANQTLVNIDGIQRRIVHFPSRHPPRYQFIQHGVCTPDANVHSHARHRTCVQGTLTLPLLVWDAFLGQPQTRQQQQQQPSFSFELFRIPTHCTCLNT